MDWSNEQAVEPGGREPAPHELRRLQVFLNSIDVEAGTDALAAPGEARDYLVRLGLLRDGQRLPAAVRDELLQLRADLREVIHANTHGDELDQAVTRRLARAADGAGLTLRVVDGEVRLATARTGAAGIVGSLLAEAEAGSSSGAWTRLKSCANEACAWVFWDSSRNHVGRWCSMAICGNRAKVQAHRRRRTA